MAGKEVCECVPVEPIKSQVEAACNNISFSDGIHADTWSKYPCVRLQSGQCRTDHCYGRVFMSFNTPPRDIRVLSVVFIRAEEKGFACLDRQLRSLFESGFLHGIPSVEKELNSPVIPSATKYLANPPPPPGSFKKKKG